MEQDTSRLKSWWAGNSTQAWRFLAVLWLAILSFLASFIFVRVADLPATYAQKSEVESLSHKVDCGFDRVNDKLDEINRFLRDQRWGGRNP